MPTMWERGKWDGRLIFGDEWEIIEKQEQEVKGGTLHFFKGDEYLHSKPADFVDEL